MRLLSTGHGLRPSIRFSRASAPHRQRWISASAGSAHGLTPKDRRAEVSILRIDPSDTVHREFHALAGAIVASQGQGRSSEGIGRLGELHKLGENLLEQLETLMQWS